MTNIRYGFGTEIQTKLWEMLTIPQQLKTLSIGCRKSHKVPQNAENPSKLQETSEKYRKSHRSWKLWQLGGVLAEKYICLPKRTRREKHSQGRNLGEVEGAKTLLLFSLECKYYLEQLFQNLTIFNSCKGLFCSTGYLSDTRFFRV